MGAHCFSKRMAMVQEEKRLGDGWFKSGQWEKAAVHWTLGVNHCHFFVSQDMAESEAAEVLRIRCKLYSNLGLSSLKAKQWDQVLECCEKVLEMKQLESTQFELTEQEAAKALYRRGVALTELKQWDSAEEELIEARKLLPGDSAIANQLVRVCAGRRSEASQQQRSCIKMLGVSGESDNDDQPEGVVQGVDEKDSAADSARLGDNMRV
eukprot:TRINITY_DN44344_c0_g1_i1.p1 TRINITY_DN44344_c0_g1~~TRINITY_DN44344_c0_g1_i1.p1  ORF type:complete len:209 (-),score=59.72 TRINITY_DN44344_c0_g1_i1:263-889(-)